MHHGSPAKGKSQRPRHEVADIVRRHGGAFREAYRLTPGQDKALRSIAQCRTAALGGHLDICVDCGFTRPAYNSCRNRHCPKCQALSQAKWIEQRMARVLPTNYFHVVFTLPSELRGLARHNPEKIYGLLLRTAAETLLELGRDPQWLGGQLGVTTVLHTWTRELKFHPHAHCVVTGGALAPDHSRWIPARGRFLFPVKVMGALFRGKFLDGLKRLRHQLLFVGACSELEFVGRWVRLLDRLYRTSWVVYAKQPFAGAKQVYRYLGRYTHRIAISDHRLIAVTDDAVRFATKNGKSKTLRPQEFLRRFVQHVLPPGFVKIRHYGLMSPAHATTTLELARELLASEDVTKTEARPAKELTWHERYCMLTGDDLRQCPRCHQQSLARVPIAGPVPSDPPDILDSS